MKKRDYSSFFVLFFSFFHSLFGQKPGYWRSIVVAREEPGITYYDIHISISVGTCILAGWSGGGDFAWRQSQPAGQPATCGEG
ncbi:uncharacterized protein LY79DRAFT_560070 [Colletotrichum navitas]|uniref:Uncharacterized protein n=1 Tax=Colletotrichum navitas TaxID=681940 RepID=A0AAD8PUE9_9PEZI|nr:uncharacterized protein LY79DRAFT_560070 [Colletotrichum navitas]KAK1584816.1 hypothetical protein LY79DRAFT_560070 [Colletotrichum navitas]